MIFEHLSLPPVFSGVRVTRSLVLYICFVDVVCPLALFLLSIVLSVLRYTDSDYPFGICNLFFQHNKKLPMHGMSIMNF